MALGAIGERLVVVLDASGVCGGEWSFWRQWMWLVNYFGWAVNQSAMLVVYGRLQEATLHMIATWRGAVSCRHSQKTCGFFGGNPERIYPRLVGELCTWTAQK